MFALWPERGRGFVETFVMMSVVESGCRHLIVIVMSYKH